MNSIIYPLTDIYVPSDRFDRCRREHEGEKSRGRVHGSTVATRYYSYPTIHEMRLGADVFVNDKAQIVKFWERFLENLDRDKILENMQTSKRRDAFESLPPGSNTKAFRKINGLWIRSMSFKDKILYLILLKQFSKKTFFLCWSTHPRNGCEVKTYYICN